MLRAFGISLWRFFFQHWLLMPGLELGITKRPRYVFHHRKRGPRWWKRLNWWWEDTYQLVQRWFISR